MGENVVLEKLENLLKIQFMFYANKYVTAKNISDRLGVTLRTAYRYIDELSLSMPIFKSKTKRASYKLDKNSKLSATFFTIEEYAKAPYI